MYITQTYLGFSAEGAKAYMYFLSETYMSMSQSHLHNEFLSRVKEFGLTTGKEIAVVLPEDGFEGVVLGDINDEVMSPIQQYYAINIRNFLPGLLISPLPIDTRKGLHSAVFISLLGIDHPFRVAKKLISEIVSEQTEKTFVDLLESLNKVVILEPNIAGIGINLNKVIEVVIEKLRKK